MLQRTRTHAPARRPADAPRVLASVLAAFLTASALLSVASWGNSARSVE